MNINCVNYKCDEPLEPRSYFLGLGLPWTLMENENAIIIGLKVRSQLPNGQSE